MKAKLIENADLNNLLDLESDFWNDVQSNKLSMTPTPAAMQPTAAIRQEWKGKSYGRVKQVSLSAAHNGRFVAFRLQWSDPDEDLTVRDNNLFVDAAAVMLASVPGAPLLLMGTTGKPVNALYWRADEGKVGRNVVAEGIGTSKTVDQEMVVCNAQWLNGGWQLIITRPLQIKTDAAVVQFSPGLETSYAIVIWDGAGGERAGIKSYAVGRDKLVIE